MTKIKKAKSDGDVERGRLIMEKTLLSVTLRMFRVGCDEKNYFILSHLPCKTDKLMKLTGLSKMPINKRLNSLEHAGLIKRDRVEGFTTTTELSYRFLGLLAAIREDVKNELPNLIGGE